MKKKHIIYLTLCMILLFLPITTQAKTFIKKGTININPNDNKDIKFTTKENGVIFIQAAVTINKTSKQGGVSIQLFNSKGKRVLNEYNTLKGYSKGTYDGWWYSMKHPSGDYYYRILNSSNIPLKFKYKIYTYSKITTKVKIPKIIIEKGKSKKIKIKEYPSGSFLLIDKEKISKNSIAEIDYWQTPKDVWIKGKKAGKTTYSFTLENNRRYKTTIEVKNPKPYIKWYSYTLDCGQSFVNKLVYAPGKVTWTSSNTKIATVSKKGKVTTKKHGTCYIYAKCKGKRYKCKVKVDRLWPNFGAYYDGYDTRDNYFTVTIRNFGKRSLVVHSAGAYSMDNDYKSYDRKLRLPSNKNVTLKPGRAKTLKFYVKGRTTWPEWDDHTIRFYVTYAKCKYLASVWYDDDGDDCAIKVGKGWYDCYWDLKQYAKYGYVYKDYDD